MERKNEITQQVNIAAPVDRVWSAITEADQIAQWFGDSATVDLRVGGRIKFGWTEFDDSVAHAVIERVEAPTTFAYRWWLDGEDQTTATLVTFDLADDGQGTLVTVVESGFDALPPHLADKFEGNTEGWISELGDLVTYVEST